jgi:FMN phosphatase YigB (HAD superfamily)
MAIRFIYFDLGNVLLSFSHEQMCAQMAAVAGIEPEAVRRALFDVSTGAGATGHSLQWRFERGEFDAAAAFEHFCAACGVRPDRTSLHAAGRDMFAELPESVALVRRLAGAGHRLGVLSNTNPVDFEFVCEQFPFLRDCFELLIVSYEAREMKPHRAIYDHAVRRAGVAAGEVFFTDDREENIAGAIAAGLDAVLFSSAEQIAKELRRRGLQFGDFAKGE